MKTADDIPNKIHRQSIYASNTMGNNRQWNLDCDSTWQVATVEVSCGAGMEIQLFCFEYNLQQV